MDVLIFMLHIGMPMFLGCEIMIGILEIIDADVVDGGTKIINGVTLALIILWLELNKIL